VEAATLQSTPVSLTHSFHSEHMTVVTGGHVVVHHTSAEPKGDRGERGSRRNSERKEKSCRQPRSPPEREPTEQAQKERERQKSKERKREKSKEAKKKKKTAEGKKKGRRRSRSKEERAVKRRTSGRHSGRGEGERARVSPEMATKSKLRSIAVVVRAEPRSPKPQVESPLPRRPPEPKTAVPRPRRPPEAEAEAHRPRRTLKTKAESPTPQPVSGQGSGQTSSEQATGSSRLLPYASGSTKRMMLLKRRLQARGEWSCFTAYVLASWERAGRGLPCRRWTPEIREVAMWGGPAEGDVSTRVAAQRANAIWEDAWDLHVWAQRLPSQHTLREQARVALWALKSPNPTGEAWPPLDLGWAEGVEKRGKMVSPFKMAAARVERLLREVGLILADGAPMLEHAYKASECHRLPTRDLRGALEAVGVLWEGDIIVRVE
jgi:hypothetical protein